MSGPLFDGAVTADRLLLLNGIRVIGVEDIIADRMGQYASNEPDMLEQAILLLKLAKNVDQEYLDRRIEEETLGAYRLGFLVAQS